MLLHHIYFSKRAKYQKLWRKKLAKLVFYILFQILTQKKKHFCENFDDFFGCMSTWFVIQCNKYTEVFQNIACMQLYKSNALLMLFPLFWKSSMQTVRFCVQCSSRYWTNAITFKQKIKYIHKSVTSLADVFFSCTYHCSLDTMLEYA